jgi:hypothetical protein
VRVRSGVIVRALDPPIPSQLYIAIHKDKPRYEALRILHAALLATRLDERKRTGNPDRRRPTLSGGRSRV